MAQIDKAEFMVNAYHYVGITDPASATSARLHIDTDIAGEDSDYSPTSAYAGHGTWISPDTGAVDASTWGSYNRLKLKGIHGFYAKH